MEVTQRVDVAIVGAGPAGSTAAALLASRGFEVALIDRDRFPRDKLCGEFLSYDALPLLAALGVLAEIDGAGAPAVERVRIIGSRRTQEFPLPRAARGISRMKLDSLLFARAGRHGAILLDGWNASALDARGVTIEHDGERRQLAARVVVGSWGRWGRFDAQLGRAFVRDRRHRHFGFKRHFRGDHPRDAIDLYSFPDGYLGVNAVEGGLTNICGLAHARRLLGLKGRWDAFVETIRREEPQLERLFAANTPAQEHFLSSDPVIFRSRSPVEGGVFLLGDASGVIDPLTGNGMAMAIQSAFLALPQLERALESAGDRQPVEDAYRREHHRFFAPRIRWSRAAASLLSRPWLLDASLRALSATPVAPLFLTRTRAGENEIARLADLAHPVT